jgi:hypothetical protein
MEQEFDFPQRATLRNDIDNETVEESTLKNFGQTAE